MSIQDKDKIKLWVAAGGICSFIDCGKKLTHGGEKILLGKMAHICGKNPGSARYDPDQSAKCRNSYENLILLCGDHHDLIDKPETRGSYSVEKLKTMKEEHEKNVELSLATKDLINLKDVKQAIIPYLAENKSIWKNFGPCSDRAKKNPNSEETHAAWLEQRQFIILSNNNKILKIIQQHQAMFPSHEQDIIADFITHVKTYYDFAIGKKSYEGVLRFPKEFEKIIKGEEHVSI